MDGAVAGQLGVPRRSLHSPLLSSDPSAACGHRHRGGRDSTREYEFESGWHPRPVLDSTDSRLLLSANWRPGRAPGSPPFLGCEGYVTAPQERLPKRPVSLPRRSSGARFARVRCRNSRPLRSFQSLRVKQPQHSPTPRHTPSTSTSRAIENHPERRKRPGAGNPPIYPSEPRPHPVALGRAGGSGPRSLESPAQGEFLGSRPASSPSIPGGRAEW